MDDPPTEATFLLNRDQSHSNIQECDSAVRPANNSSVICITVLTGFVISFIIIFTASFFSLEVSELSAVLNNSTRNSTYTLASNIIESIYLFLAFALIIFHINYFVRDNNRFFPTSFDNYPMLIVMICCGLVDASYYVIRFTTIISDPSSELRFCKLISCLAELFFCVGMLPFVIICVSHNVRPNHPHCNSKTMLLILLVGCGCFILFIRRLSIKIERDIKKPIFSDNNEEDFIFHTVVSLENVFIVVDMTYALIALVFLVDPLFKLMRLRALADNMELIDPSSTNSVSFLTKISLVRYRWPTIVLSIGVVIGLLIELYVVSNIQMSALSSAFKVTCETVNLYCMIATHAIGIMYGAVYYYSDIRTWPLRNNPYIRNDDYFNKLSSTVQVGFAISMIIACMSVFRHGTALNLNLIQIIESFLMAVQVFTQAVCIHLANQKYVLNHKLKSWNSVLFPAWMLAVLNCGFMIVNIFYSVNDTFRSSIQSHDVVFYVIRDLTNPISIINRAHGMAFFINLAIRQWNVR